MKLNGHEIDTRPVIAFYFSVNGFFLNKFQIQKEVVSMSQCPFKYIKTFFINFSDRMQNSVAIHQ